MNHLIFTFLDGKPDGETVNVICQDVSRYFNLGNVRIEEHLDDLVDAGQLKKFHVNGSLRYARNTQ